MVSPGDPRRIVYESQMEKRAAYLFFADPSVVDVHDQPPPVIFLDADGVEKSHTFDFLVTYRDGRRVAIAVRPAERSAKLLVALKLIAAQIPPSYANEIRLVAEVDMPANRVFNAVLANAVRRDGPGPDDDVVLGVARTLRGTFTLGSLIATSGLAGRAYRAAARLIADGVLELVDDGQKVDYPALIRCAAAGREAA